MTDFSDDYVNRNAELPHMGSSGLGPRALTASDVEVIMACTDPTALALMAAYARSYFATAGGIALGGLGVVIGSLMGRQWLAVGGAVAAAGSAMVTIEARRRARQWEAVAQARLTTLAGQR